MIEGHLVSEKDKNYEIVEVHSIEIIEVKDSKILKMFDYSNFTSIGDGLKVLNSIIVNDNSKEVDCIQILVFQKIRIVFSVMNHNFVVVVNEENC